MLGLGSRVRKKGHDVDLMIYWSDAEDRDMAWFS